MSFTASLKERKRLASGLITLATLAWVLYILKDIDLHTQAPIQPSSIMISLGFAMISFLLSGVQFYVIRRPYTSKLTVRESLLIPLVQHYWSYVLPTQGSIVFTSLYLKQRLGIQLNQSLGINVFLSLVTVTATIITLFVYFSLNEAQELTPTVLAYLVACLCLIYIVSKLALKGRLFLRSVLSGFSAATQFLDFIEGALSQVTFLFKQTKILWTVLIINLAKKVVTALWYFWITTALQINLTFLEVMLFSLLMELLLLVKITPGNLGVAQIIGGSLTVALNGNIQDGTLISVCATLTTLCVALSIGLIGNYYLLSRIENQT